MVWSLCPRLTTFSLPLSTVVHILLHSHECPISPQVTGLWSFFSAFVNSSSGKGFENRFILSLIKYWWITSLWGLILRFNTKKCYTKWKRQQDMFWWSEVFQRSLEVWAQRGLHLWKRLQKHISVLSPYQYWRLVNQQRWAEREHCWPPTGDWWGKLWK